MTWISVKDRLPEIRKEVLLCDCKPYYESASCDVGHTTDDSGELEWATSYGTVGIDCYTHWMPLPDPPKEI